MNQIKCANCNVFNNLGMSFCTNCGKAIFQTAQSNVPTVEKISELNTVEAVRKNSGTKKTNSKFWIVGLLGCLGLIVFGVIGIGLLGMASYFNTNNEIADKNKSNQNNNRKETNFDNNSNADTNKKSDSEEDEKELIDILNDRKEAGRFKQLETKTVDVKDFFPYAKAAAQTSYHDGSKYISVAIGKFNNFDDTKKNFDEQFANVKKKGGKSQILETSVDGTINGVYQVKDVFSAEYCTKSAFCYRMVSKDPKSLTYFIKNFITF